MTSWRRAIGLWVVLGLVGNASGQQPQRTAGDPAVRGLIDTVTRVGAQGEGSPAARGARDALSRGGVETLLPLLEGMSAQQPVAANFLRTAFDDIVSRESQRTDVRWPISQLKTFVGEQGRSGRARRLALGLVEQLEPGFREQWIGTQLDDLEFGYEAVAQTLAAGEAALRDKKSDLAAPLFRKAFESARDAAQVTTAAARLTSLGQTADPVAHLGLIGRWWVLGPFDAPGKTGFATVFEPEMKHNLDAKYTGQDGKSIAWKVYQSRDKLAQLNLIDPFGTVREAVGYAFCEIELDAAIAGEVRCGADDNCTVWLNGERVFGREQWLNGTRFDRFSAPIKLKAGRNALLVKICQGPQHKDPEVPNNWSLQLRLCDTRGTGLRLRIVSPEKEKTP